MPYTDEKRFWGIIFVMLPLVLAFAIAYYNSAISIVKPYQIFRAKYYNKNPLHHHQPNIFTEQTQTDQIFLKKDEKYFLNNACLVFKGISNGKVNLDLYMLEFDPDISYPLSLTKESLSRGLLINNTFYKFVSVKKNQLHLKIQGSN